MADECPGHFHLETSSIIEQEIRSHEPDETFTTADGTTYSYGDEKKRWQTGKLSSSGAVIHWLKNRIIQYAQDDISLVFSGSPRTLEEAHALIPLFCELYGSDNVHVFLLNVAPNTSMYRNSNRRVCLMCRRAIPYTRDTMGMINCPNGTHVEATLTLFCLARQLLCYEKIPCVVCVP